MALSVSGFPEQSRAPGSSADGETFSTGESGGQDGVGRTILMSSPRLRGLFGGGGSGTSSGKKPASPGEGTLASMATAATNYSDNDDAAITHSSTAPSTPIVSSSSPLSFSPSFEPLSQQKYDLDTPPMFDFDAVKGPSSAKRIQPLPPVPRKMTASPVRLGPSLTRLDIGAIGPRSPTMAIPNKLPMPSVVIEEWSQKSPETPSTLASKARPLPVVPSPEAGPAKTSNSLARGSPNYPESSTRSLISGAEPYKHVNAVPGPSQYPETHPKSKTSSVPSTPTTVHITESFSIQSASQRSSPQSVVPVPSSSAPSSSVMLVASEVTLAKQRPNSKNAVAGSSKHVNAVAGPSNHREAYSTTAASSSHSQSTSSASPVSKVFITQPQSQRTFKTSLTMRYQPLVGEPPASSSPADSTPSSAHISSPTRPLPLIAPKAVHANPGNSILSTLPTPPRVGVPAGARTKRSKTTSTNVITGISTTRGGPTSASPMGLSRSPFDNVSPSWAARQPDASPLPFSSNPTMSTSRARSHSRLSRRDRSMDSHHSTTRSSPATSRMPSPVSVRTVRNNSRPRAATVRALPSPTNTHSGGNTRPVKHAATVDFIAPVPPIPPGTLALQMHIADSPLEAAANFSRIQSPTRTQPPSPPVGPKLRTKPTPPAPPPMPWIVTNQITPPRAPLSSVTPVTGDTSTTTTSTRYSLCTTPPTTAPGLSDDCDDTYSVEAPLHSHPLETISDSESMVNPPLTPVEVFIDDQDYSTLSRSPSPIRYARPDSRGNLSSDDDAADGVSSSPAPSSSDEDQDSPGRTRRRKQLRAYRNSYRPKEGGEPPHIPYLRRSPSPVDPHHQQQQLRVPEPAHENADEKAKRKKKKARSYFSEYISGSSLGSVSVPATRASSPERKSRSRQPRKLANAMSLALDVRSKNNGSQRNASTSPRRTTLPASSKPAKIPSWTATAFDDGEVLDIGRSSPLMQQQHDVEDGVGMETGTASSQTSSARSSAKVGWVKSITRNRLEISGEVGSLEQSFSLHEMDGSDLPHAAFAASNSSSSNHNNSKTASVLHYTHRRTDSVQAEYSSPSINAIGLGAGEERDSERYVIPSGSASISNNKPLRNSNPSIVSSGASRTPASSLSNHSSSFAAFGIISRYKKPAKQGLEQTSSSVSLLRSVPVKDSESGSSGGLTFHSGQPMAKSGKSQRKRGGEEDEWGDEWTGGPTG